MKLSQNFTKTQRETPKGEVSRNAQLLTQAGFIHKELAGAYAYLPLGLKVLKKIEQIIREEMNALGAQELYLTALQEKDVWEATDRWRDDAVDIWFKTELQGGQELGLANTHEEPLTRLMAGYINSYKDLPVLAYQFQTKFRNELRAKSGLLRGREFLMKDLYSFTRDQKEHDQLYEQAKEAYLKIFDRVGIGPQTFVTFASGGSFSKYSHEFQTLCDAGEDTIYLDESKKLAVNKEVYEPAVLADLGLKEADLIEKKAIEVGNIFSLGTRFSEPLGLRYTDSQGAEQKVIMGSYGIGLGRVMGTVVEVSHDERGIIWPKTIAPADAHLIVLGEDEAVRQSADRLYQELLDSGVDVICDDREESAGVKFADADLIGIPVRLTVSAKTLEQESVEVKERTAERAELMPRDHIPGLFA